MRRETVVDPAGGRGCVEVTDELRIDDRCVNPARYLAELVIPPKATQTYHSVMKATRLRRARAKLKS